MGWEWRAKVIKKKKMYQMAPGLEQASRLSIQWLSSRSEASEAANEPARGRNKIRLIHIFILLGCSTGHRVLLTALATAVKAAGAGGSSTAVKTDSLISRRNAI